MACVVAEPVVVFPVVCTTAGEQLAAVVFEMAATAIKVAPAVMAIATADSLYLVAVIGIAAAWYSLLISICSELTHLPYLA
jgi:hypothetical protein